MAKYRSRATRASDQAGDWRGIAESLREVVSDLAEDATDEQKNEATKKAQEIIGEFDASEVESLAEEMGSWRDNMSGTGLENTETYSRVEEAASTLESIDTDAPEIDDFGDIEQAADTLESRADELESVEFPGMFGR